MPMQTVNLFLGASQVGAEDPRSESFREASLKTHPTSEAGVQARGRGECRWPPAAGTAGPGLELPSACCLWPETRHVPTEPRSLCADTVPAPGQHCRGDWRQRTPRWAPSPIAARCTMAAIRLLIISY